MRRAELGTAVLLPALRNPVVMAHQVATLDQIAEGRLILGVGIAADVPNIRAEFAAAGVPFEKRVGRLLEGLRLCRALWSGKPVDWDGLWKVQGGVLGPTPHRPAGRRCGSAARIRQASSARANTSTAGCRSRPTLHAGPSNGPRSARQPRNAGRDANALVGAMYLTIAVDEDVTRANARLDAYLERYYGQPAAVLRTRQACYAGGSSSLAEWLAGYVQAGASHLVLRFAGDHERHLETVAALRPQLG